MLEFATELKQLRKVSGLSQRELAEKLGCSFTYISKLENNRPCYPPSDEFIVNLALIFGVDNLRLMLLAGKLPDYIQRQVVRELLATEGSHGSVVIEVQIPQGGSK